MKAGIFASAGKNIGYGHYGRCRALKEGFEERGINAVLHIQGECERDVIGDDAVLCDWIKSDFYNDFDVCIIDSYLTDENDLKKAADSCGLSVFIDDCARLEYPDGIILNGSLFAEEIIYPGKLAQMILAGSKYAMLRKPFWDFGNYATERRGVFLSAGGSGADNILTHVCDFLLDNTEHDIFMIGKSTVTSPRVHSFFGLSAEEMADVMSGCLFAVSAAGQTSYELARLGVPSVFFGIAENQRFNLNAWGKTGFAVSVGFYGEKHFFAELKNALAYIQSTENIRSMSSLGPLYVDGQGVRRTVETIIEVLN